MTKTMPPTNSPLSYQGQQLHFNGKPLKDYAAKKKTPFYLYSKSHFKQAFTQMQQAAQEAQLINPLLCFALKANHHPGLLKLLAKLGGGADVVSGGELQAALDAGIPAERIVFSGVGKTEAEIKLGLKSQIYSFNVESTSELEMIQTLAGRHKPRVAFRLNPQVEAKTHKHISTGSKLHKFGMLKADILKAARTSQFWSKLKLVGISMHIGSQLTELNATKRALQQLAETALQLSHPLEFLDVGGGLGIDYHPSQRDKVPSMQAYMQLIQATLHKYFYQKSSQTPRILFEPGRILAARMGVFVTRVILVKTSEDKRFAVVDGGMNDFARPALYQAYHEIYSVHRSPKQPQAYDVVGPICETTDCFAQDRQLPPLEPGDLLVIADAGAYGHTMSSSYNLRPLPQEYLVS